MLDLVITKSDQAQNTGRCQESYPSMLWSAGVFTVPVFRRPLFSMKYKTGRDLTRITSRKCCCALNYIHLLMSQQVSTNVLYSITASCSCSKFTPVWRITIWCQWLAPWTLSVKNYVATLIGSRETHNTQPFYCSSGICPGPSGWAGTRKVKPGRLKPIWIYWSKR